MYTTPLFIFVDLSAIYSTMLHGRLNMGERNRLSCWNFFATPDIELHLNAKHNDGLPMEHIPGFTRSHTGCCHRASARIASPQRLPLSTNSVENTKH
jgi:hypothetical protein